MSANEADEVRAMLGAYLDEGGENTLAALVRRSGVSENTIRKFARGEPVTDSKLAQLRRGLGDPPTVRLLNGNAPPEVRAGMQMVGFWLLGMPPEERGQAIMRLAIFMSQPGT